MNTEKQPKENMETEFFELASVPFWEMENYPLSKKQLIIQSFEGMYVEILDDLLDDSRTYLNTTKNIFLSKLEYQAFFELRISGDTALVAHKGYCGNKDCINYGRYGFSFVGNNSNKHIDLIFEENEKGYADIRFCCDGFHTLEPVGNLNKLININVYSDEQTDLKQNANNITILLQKCKIAIEEFCALNTLQPMNNSQWLDWSIEHHYLFHYSARYSSHFPDLEVFDKLRNAFFSLTSYSINEENSKKALKEYYALSAKEDSSLSEWLTKYLPLRVEISQCDLSLFLKGVTAGKEFFRIECVNVNVAASDFEWIAKFKKQYDTHYEL